MVRLARILCPIDFSDVSRHALTQAVDLAKWYRSELTVLHVFHSVTALDLAASVMKDIDRERLVAEMRRFAGETPPALSMRFIVREATDVRSEILAQAEALEADLLVIGSHGRSGFDRLVLGSVAEKVVRKAPCPVMVVPPHAPDPMAQAPLRPGRPRVLCPVDFGDSSVRALAYAADIAREADAELTVLHVIEVPPELGEHSIRGDFNIEHVRAGVEAECLRRLRELTPESVRARGGGAVVREGAAYRQILQQAAEQATDLIVMGVQGHGALDRLVFGSNSEHVIRHATCPVLTVR